MPEVLVIDDNREILDANASYLTKQGFTVTAADSGLKAVALISSQKFDCIVLDILMPDLDGYAICKAARTVTDTPILFLSALDEMRSKLRGLKIGGDDYMTKPYSLRELGARVKALTRRAAPDSDKTSETGEAVFYIDRDKRQIRLNGRSVFLSQREFNLFLLFYENPGSLFLKETIMKEIWPSSEKGSGIVAVYVMKLRKKIQFAEKYLGVIESRYGAGYSLTPPP
jgi:DNA-binding response OmpR family regulator